MRPQASALSLGAVRARRRWPLAALLVLLLCCLSRTSADASDRLDYRLVTTPAGLAMHYRRSAETPYAALSFAWRNEWGPLNPGKEGAVSIGPALLMRAFDATPDGPLVERLKDIEATASISARLSAVQASVVAPPANLFAAAEALAGVLGAPLPEKVFQRLKRQSARSAEQSELQPAAMAQRALQLLAGGDDHPMVLAARPGRFDRLELADVEAWRQSVLRRDGLLIAFNGDLDEAEAARIVDSLLARLPLQGAAPAYAWPSLRFKPQTVVVERDSPQAVIAQLGATGVEPGPRAVLATLGVQVLGGGADGRLFARLRSGLGATYGATAGLSPWGREAQTMMIATSVDHAHARPALDAIRETHAAWRAGGVTEAELAPARTRLATTARQNVRDPAAANSRILTYLLSGLGIDLAQSYPERALRVTAGEANAFAREALPPPEAMLTVIVAPRAEGLGADCIARSLAEVVKCR